MQKVGSHLSPHYTVGDVAGMLGLTQAQVRTLIHTKQLPAEKKGNEYRVLAADFERYCAGTRGSQVDKREVVCTRRGFLRGASLGTRSRVPDRGGPCARNKGAAIS